MSGEETGSFLQDTLSPPELPELAGLVSALLPGTSAGASGRPLALSLESVASPWNQTTLLPPGDSLPRNSAKQRLVGEKVKGQGKAL